MANIFLTKKCNLKCPYCFADEFVNKDQQEISIENFMTILNFIKTNPGERVGLIGGEPTTHSRFNEILEIIQHDDDVKNAVIFTNGIEIEKSTEFLKDKKFSLLINCNSPKDIGERFYNKLKNNIKILKENKINFNLGINLYSDKLDYDYIFELLKIAESNRLRFSTALPNCYKEETDNVLSDFLKFKPYLFQFFNDCIENNIIPGSDCNFIPHCLLEIEDKKTMLKIAKLEKVLGNNEFSINHICNPVIDILPDLTAIRCFGLSKYKKVKISEFKKIESLRKYFFNKIDIYARVTHISRQCSDCSANYLEKCGVCFTYKINKINENIQKLNCL